MKNKQILEILENIIKTEKIVNGYIFLGIGKTQNYEYARKFAKKILCMNNGEDNCRCKSCIVFDDNNHTDYYELNKDVLDSIKIEDIRNIQKEVFERPVTSNRKVYIINNADKMTIEAQNCLLKTLEEPPECVTIILVSNNENNILPTIKSRCTFITFTEESTKDLTIEEQERMGQLKEVFGNIDKYLSVDLLNKLDVLYKDKDNIMENLDFINQIFFEKSRDDEKYLNYIDYVEKTKLKIKRSCNYDMCIDNLILNIWE